MILERPIKTRMELRIIAKKINTLYGFNIAEQRGRRSTSAFSEARAVFVACSLALTTETLTEISNTAGVKLQTTNYYVNKIKKPSLGLKMAIQKAFEYLNVEQRLSFDRELKTGQKAIKALRTISESIDLSEFETIEKQVKKILNEDTKQNA